MNLSYSNFKNILKNYNCFESKVKIAVGVSGGPDSIALVIRLNKWIGEFNGKIIAIIVNHNIRKNSKNEAKSVNDFLLKNKIESKIITLKNNNKKFSMNSLRIKRFRSMTNYCKKNNILHLFLAHHFDDNIETFLNRKITGSSFEGLKAIDELIVINKILIIRPLLSFKKEQIYKYLKKNSINYLEDPTNKDENYTRVVIRNFLKTIDSKVFEKEYSYLLKLMPIYFNMIMENLIYIVVKINRKEIIIDNSMLKNIDNLIIERLIIYIYAFFFGKEARLRSNKISILISKIRDNKTKFFNIKSLLIYKKYNLLIFSPKKT